jgi:hypothetical protein
MALLPPSRVTGRQADNLTPRYSAFSLHCRASQATARATDLQARCSSASRCEKAIRLTALVV